MNAKQRYSICAHALHHYWNEVLKPQIRSTSTEDDRNKLNDYFYAFQRMAKLSGETFENAPSKIGKGDWKQLLKTVNGR